MDNKKKLIIIAGLIILIAVILTFFILEKVKTKTLICTLTTNDSTMKITNTITTTFYNDKLKSIDKDMNIEIKSSFIKYKETIINNLKEQYNKYKNNSNFLYNIKDTDNTVNVTATLKNNFDKNIIEVMNVNNKVTYKESKKEYKNKGYVCK